MKFLVFLLLAAVVVAAIVLFITYRKREGKPVAAGYVVVTDKVIAAGGPKLPDGIDYRFYDTIRYTSGGYSYTRDNCLVVKFNGETYQREVSAGWDDPAAALCDAAELLHQNFKRDYNAWSKEQQLKKFIYKSNDLPVIGKRVGWREDT